MRTPAVEQLLIIPKPVIQKSVRIYSNEFREKRIKGNKTNVFADGAL